MADIVDTPNGQQPLKGVFLCCTSINQDERTRLADFATQMGAVHKLDLTSDVTHLVVGSITTPKYRYVAKERPDIKVLGPGWLVAVRASWMEGGDVDVERLEKANQLPTFSGLQICVTGFDNMEQRNDISSTVVHQGATYHGDLTKQVTHLIAAAPQGAKYTHAKQWGIKIVSLKWFDDSMERGMALDEELYDPMMPTEEQGRDAFRRSFQPRTSLGKRPLDRELQNVPSGDASRKKLRRSISSRLESQSQDILHDISARDAALEPSAGDQWNDGDDSSTTLISDLNVDLGLRTNSSAVQTGADRGPETSEGPEGLFSGCYVLLHGFEQRKKALLRQILEQNGATVVDSATELQDASRNAFFKSRRLLVPHDTSDSSIALPEMPSGTITATEWWVERCIHYKRQLDPAQDVLSSPLGEVKVPGFSELIISTTGFTGVDLRQLSRAVKLMGAAYQEKLLPSCSVLIGGSTMIRKEKVFYANKHHIPVVSADWLWACLRLKEKTPFDKFNLQLPILDPEKFISERSTSSPVRTDLLNNQRTDGTRDSKEEPRLKRLSNAHRKHATPPLPLHAAKAAPGAPTLRPRPIVHEDENEDGCLLEDSDTQPKPTAAATFQEGSHPLKEVSSNSSTQKRSDSSNGEIGHVPAKREAQGQSPSPKGTPSPPNSPRAIPSKDADQHLPMRPQHQLTADLAEILNRKAASRASSESRADPPQRRKNRPLGRAASGLSNRSLSASTSAHSEHLPSALQTDVLESAADGFRVSSEAPLPPSTQLSYETAEAEAHRLQMSKKMGTKLHDDVVGMRRVASLGTVKDSSLTAEGGVANRIKGRQRAK